jgi:hypothetical protein
MKKLVLVCGAALLAFAPMTSTVAWAAKTAVNEATANALADQFVAAAKAAEASAKSAGKSGDELRAAIVAAIEASVEQAVSQGNTGTDISAALVRGGNTPGISADVAAAFGVVQQQLAALLEKNGPGATEGNGGGAGGVGTPTPPSPSVAGTGYVSGS